jgi:hypothetical protein
MLRIKPYVTNKRNMQRKQKRNVKGLRKLKPNDSRMRKRNAGRKTRPRYLKLRTMLSASKLLKGKRRSAWPTKRLLMKLLRKPLKKLQD